MRKLLNALAWILNALAWIPKAIVNLFRPLFAPDKLAHFFMGSLVGLAALWMGWWAMLPVAIIAIAKEVYDAIRPFHKVELLDAVATTLGGLTAVILIMLRFHYAA